MLELMSYHKGKKKKKHQAMSGYNFEIVKYIILFSEVWFLSPNEAGITHSAASTTSSSILFCWDLFTSHIIWTVPADFEVKSKNK